MASNKNSVSLGKPLKSYRVIIRQTKPNKEENCNSFMIYDFKGKSKIESIKEQLRKNIGGV